MNVYGKIDEKQEELLPRLVSARETRRSSPFPF